MIELQGVRWAFAYIGLFALFVPVLNILCWITLLTCIRRGKLEPTVWKKYLVVNGGISVSAFLHPYIFLSLVLNEQQLLIYSFTNIVGFVIILGVVFQEIFFVIWLWYFLRKKELATSYYTTWQWGFALLYLLPNALFFAWLIGSSLNV